MAALIAVAWLAVPVSTIAGITGLEMEGMPLALSAEGYWLALALVAVLCSPQVFGRSSASAGAVASSAPTRGDA